LQIAYRDGEQSLVTAITLRDIGDILNHKCCYDEAISNYEKGLAIVENNFQDDHSEIARFYENIGRSWEDKSDFIKAVEYQQKSRDIRVEHQDPDVAVPLGNLGSALCSLKRYDEALSNYEHALSILKQRFKGDDMEIALIYNGMSMVFKEQGRLQNALDLNGKAFNMIDSICHSGHPF
jgi:tetratricopeptide (TPR) repeat protein